MDLISEETLTKITDRLVAGITSSVQFGIRDAATALDGFELTIGPVTIPEFKIKLSKPPTVAS